MKTKLHDVKPKQILYEPRFK